MCVANTRVSCVSPMCSSWRSAISFTVTDVDATVD